MISGGWVFGGWVFEIWSGGGGECVCHGGGCSGRRYGRRRPSVPLAAHGKAIGTLQISPRRCCRLALGVCPGGADRHMHLERHRQIGRVAHHVDRQLSHLGRFRRVDFEDHLVMHLQHEPARSGAGL